MVKKKQTAQQAEPQREYMKLVAGKVSQDVKNRLKQAREAKGWNESQFVRYAVELALRQEQAA